MPAMGEMSGISRKTPLEPHDLGLGEVFQQTSDAVIVAEAKGGRVVAWNDAAVRLFGYTRDEANGLLVEDLVPSSLKERHRDGITRFAQDGRGYLVDSGSPIALPAVRKDGSEFSVELSLSTLRPRGVPGRYAMAIVRDATLRKQLEGELQRSYELLERTQTLAKVGSWELGVSADPGDCARWSPEMYRIHGVDQRTFTMSAENVDALIHPDDLKTWKSRLGEAVAAEKDLDGFSYRTVHPDGSTHWVWTEGAFQPDRPSVLVGFVRDITEQKAAEAALAHLALIDDLTGLRNRRGFLTVADPLLHVAARQRHDFVLLYVDLDNLKEINDTHGHSAGDRVLVETADLLRNTFRESDIIARLGGDELCVLLHGKESQAPLDRLAAAIRARGDELPPISLSVGAAVHTWDEPPSVEELIDRADAAMYEEKARRKGNSQQRR